jgi:hypothetical protein
MNSLLDDRTKIFTTARSESTVAMMDSSDLQLGTIDVLLFLLAEREQPLHP